MGRSLAGKHNQMTNYCQVKLTRYVTGRLRLHNLAGL
jgi:hypothetical protein